ncbi:V-type ATPase assembly factor PKR1 [Cercospora zeina]
MADFLTNLWESVFTPGTTPTLLIATNITFASLQTLLFGLLLATYSIHFAILSVLCGGLWYSINWFAHELQAAQRAEDEAERLRKRKTAATGGEKGDIGDADDEGEDTEVEVTKGMADSMVSLTEGSHLDQGVGGLEKEKREEIARLAEQDPDVGSAASGAQTGSASSETRQRQLRRGEMSSSEFSTDMRVGDSGGLTAGQLLEDTTQWI